MDISPRDLFDVGCDLYMNAYFMWQPLVAFTILRCCTYPWRKSLVIGRCADFVAKWSLVALLGSIVVTSCQ
jgi:hypothetical protein